MGVYIDMEMPKVGSKIITIYANGKVLYDGGYIKAVSVPEPHGRLGDLDKLNEEVRLLIKENMFSRDDARDLLETIADAPTVIPASKEAE